MLVLETATTQTVWVVGSFFFFLYIYVIFKLK